MANPTGRIRLGAAAVVLVAAVVAHAADRSIWPSFRGLHASGFDDDARVPAHWDTETGKNIKWKTPIPGLAHSSPIVWGDRVFVTSAVSSDPDPYLRIGLYGASPDHPEHLVHAYKIFCLDTATGRLLWEHTAHRGVPKVKRHVKATHANSTPATDGRHVVAFFGSEGLYCYDMTGKLLWSRDLGLLDSGAFDVPALQWGFGSSPIIHGQRVIVQCDVNNQSFLAVFDVNDGREIWRTPRDEGAGWGTPTIYQAEGRTRLAVNGYHHIGGYDLETGREVWRIAGGGDVPVPTPVVADGLIYITNAHGATAPIYAIRTTAVGDISLAEGAKSNAHVAWSYRRGGAYMQTPLVYRGLLYNCRDNGALTVYDAKTGKVVYRKRLAGGGVGFTASPVAGGGNVYFTSEEGDIHVLRAGREFELLSVNSMGEVCMATPAIVDGTLLVRSRGHVTAIGHGSDSVVSP